MSRLETISKAIFYEGRNVYISGIAGSGKSYLLKELYNDATINKKLICELTSTTGVSAFNIGGCTIHSWSGIVLPSQLPKDVEEFISRIVTRIKVKKYMYHKWLNINILFIDEISMLGANYIDVLDNVARRVRKNNKPFGGIQVVCSGDVLQLPPVNDSFCFDSQTWNELNFKNYILTKAYRFTDQEWSDILQRARIGKLTNADINTLSKCLTKDNNSDIQPTVIYSLRKDVEDINQAALDDLKSNFITFECKDNLDVETLSNSLSLIRECTEEQSKILDSNLNVGRVVKLKLGAQVMLVANLDVASGLVNGSRGVITYIDKTRVVVKFKGKTHEFEEEIPYFAFKVEHQGEKLVRNMIPLIAAYASTIHKMQGLTIDCAVVNCGDSIFSAGQAYVALSRCRSIDGLFLESFKPSKIFPNKRALDYEEKIKKSAIFIDNL